MSDLPESQDVNEDLFDFPQVEGFSPEFLEAARMQTEAANNEESEVTPSFDEGDESRGEEEEPGYDDFEDDFEDEFADNFADLMGEPTESPIDESPQEAPAEEAVAAQVGPAGRFDLRPVWGALALLFVTNLIWAWTWHASEGRLRGEMDQRFQGYLTQQRNQLEDAVTALSPAEGTTEIAMAPSPLLDDVAQADPSGPTLEEIKRDLMHARYETARAKAWRLIAQVDSFPAHQRASTETSAHLLIAESYEAQGTDTQENEG